MHIDLNQQRLNATPDHTVQDCTLGWVDIGTVAKVPLNVVVYIKKVGKIT
jgi:hypothetical protein